MDNSAVEELARVITSYYAGSETPSGLVIPVIPHGGFLIESRRDLISPRCLPGGRATPS